VNLAALEKSLGKGSRLQRNPWTRLNWIRQGDRALLFAAGDNFSCPLEFAPVLCGPALPGTAWQDLGPEAAHLLVELINAGHIWLENPQADRS